MTVARPLFATEQITPETVSPMPLPPSMEQPTEPTKDEEINSNVADAGCEPKPVKNKKGKYMMTPGITKLPRGRPRKSMEMPEFSNRLYKA